VVAKHTNQKANKRIDSSVEVVGTECLVQIIEDVPLKVTSTAYPGLQSDHH